MKNEELNAFIGKKADRMKTHNTADDRNVKQQQEDISYVHSGESVFLMTFLGVVTVGFCCLAYLIIF